MGDPRAFNSRVAVELGETLEMLLKMLEEVPDAQVAYAERYSNPRLLGSPYDLLSHIAIDHAVREAHGVPILVGALARIVAAQRDEISSLGERISELERRLETFREVPKKAKAAAKK